MDTAIEKNWEVYALKYAERADRTRSDSFIFDDHSHQAHTIDYFIWVLKSEKDIIVVDTGYDYDEAKRRDRPIQRAPSEALKAINVEPAKSENPAADNQPPPHCHPISIG